MSVIDVSNTIGVVCGCYLFWRLLCKKRPATQKQKEKP